MSEGKKGRVICSWCGKDMGEAETELDTRGCCLGCLKLALREVDERLAAFRQGQEAGQRALVRELTKVVELAEFWEEAVSEAGEGRLGLEEAVELVTKPGFQSMELLPLQMLRGDWRWYVPDILSEHWEELSLETGLALLVAGQTFATANAST